MVESDSRNRRVCRDSGDSAINPAKRLSVNKKADYVSYVVGLFVTDHSLSTHRIGSYSGQSCWPLLPVAPVALCLAPAS